MRHIVDSGRAPSIEEMAQALNVERERLKGALEELQSHHGVVLHPKSSEVWIMHPFSTAPTNFWISAEDGAWWGNCAWCSLGAAHLLQRDLTITTTLGGESRQRVVDIRGGEIQNLDLLVHFPIPMTSIWDNVVFSCSTMLLFESEIQIDDWCERHGIPKGDIQPIGTVWSLAKAWYANHLDRNWKKWTIEEARRIFERFDLTGRTWKLPERSGSF